VVLVLLAVVGVTVVLDDVVLVELVDVEGAAVVVVVEGRHAASPPHRLMTPFVHRFGRGAFSKARTQRSRAQPQTLAQRRADDAA